MAFRTLFRTAHAEAPHGYMEACRVLAHIFKDKYKEEDPGNKYKGVDGKEDWSMYMEIACKEAIECLDVPAEVKTLRPKGKGKGDFGAYRNPPPGPPGHGGSSSSSSGFYQDPKGKGKGKGKDKGKGTFQQKGLR